MDIPTHAAAGSCGRSKRPIQLTASIVLCATVSIFLWHSRSEVAVTPEAIIVRRPTRKPAPATVGVETVTQEGLPRRGRDNSPGHGDGVLVDAAPALAGRAVVHVCAIGDSLTRGVGAHGSYRDWLVEAVLHRYSQARRSNDNEPPPLPDALIFQGSERLACVAKKPNEAHPGKRYASATDEARGVASAVSNRHPHFSWCLASTAHVASNLEAVLLSHHGIGHPSASTGRLRSEVVALNRGTMKPGNVTVSDGGDDEEAGGPVSTAQGSRPSSSRVTVLVMVGHNDVFNAARRCRVKELTPWPWSAGRGENGLGPADTFDLPLLRTLATFASEQPLEGTSNHEVSVDNVTSRLLLSQVPGWLRCSMDHLEVHFASQLRRLFRLLASRADALTSASSSSSSAAALRLQLDGDNGTRRIDVLVGVNPPTGFPALDVLLHVMLAREAHRCALVDCHLRSPGPRPSGLSLVLVPFCGFQSAFLPHSLTAQHDRMVGNIFRGVRASFASHRRTGMGSIRWHECAAVRRSNANVGEKEDVGARAPSEETNAALNRAERMKERPSSAGMLSHTFDSTHPNVAGAQLLAARWADALFDAWSRPTAS